MYFAGNTSRTSHYTVFHKPTVSDPGHSADLRTVQCSVLTDVENKMCSGDLSVFWFRAEAEESHPDIIYVDKSKHGKCEKRSNSQRSCFYHFSKNVASSDSALYYCAIATCGQILIGNATKREIGKSLSYTERLVHQICSKQGYTIDYILSFFLEGTGGFQFTVFLTLVMCFVFSVIVNIGFICYRLSRTACKCFKGKFELIKFTFDYNNGFIL